MKCRFTGRTASSGPHGRGMRACCAVLSAAALWLLPLASQAIQPRVAIHDSEFTRALESIPASGATPTGPETTGFQWWPTNWHYFVMPDSAKQMLASDGTAYAVVSDAQIGAGQLLDGSGHPNYPILLSLSCEAIDNGEIGPLSNYVAAGGILFVGGSSFTRGTNGISRGDFALASEMGIHMLYPALTNWTVNSTFTAVSEHPLITHIPQGTLTWQMPASSEEISWPEIDHVPNPPTGLPHLLWQVQPGGATVIAAGDSRPYLLVQHFGQGWFIYDAAMEPLLGHGGWAPGMYAYGIVRNAIQWAFQCFNMAVPRLSPWPYSYNAAVIFRHDMEALPSVIESIEPSAIFESTNNAWGDYYFCTGELRLEMTNEAAEVASLQRAVTNDHATVMPHNGGLTNLNVYVPPLTTNSYDYWHWGPDEMLDDIPPGYSNGTAYGLVSLSNAYNDINGWLPFTNNGAGVKMTVTPYFNATREASVKLESQLGVQTTGDDKLGPFPHWTLSTQTPDEIYNILNLPVSDWFIGSQIAQAMENGHSVVSVQELVDYYYGIGALINLYCHSSSDGTGAAGPVASFYVTYSVAKPQILSTNTAGIYRWWLKRGTAQVTPGYGTHSPRATNSAVIVGASDPSSSVEFYMPSPAWYGLQVYTNGAAAGTNAYRTFGQALKVHVGTAVTNTQVVFKLGPTAGNDTYAGTQGAQLVVPAPGVLGNDTNGTTTGSLTATTLTAPTDGSLSLSASGSFTYTPAPGFAGVDGFTYQAGDGQTNSTPATVDLMVTPPGYLFYDNLARPAGTGCLLPWVQQLGSWNITNGTFSGSSPNYCYGSAYYTNSAWTDYTVQAQIQFSGANPWGGGIGGRLNPATGAHYGAWVYPEGSGGGSRVLKVIKFEGWTTWSSTPMATAVLPPIGTNWHSLTLAMQSTNIMVYLDGALVLNTVDNNFDGVPAYTNGGITADMYTYPAPSGVAFQNVVATAAGAPLITEAPQSQTVIAGSTVTLTSSSLGTNPTYQWYKNGTNQLTDGGSISGSATPTLTLQNVFGPDSGAYSIVVSNSLGTITSTPSAQITVVDPAITNQPTGLTNGVGTSASFSVGAAGTPPLQYQWLKGAAPIGGATNATFTLVSVTNTDAANYSVTVSNILGGITSSNAVLVVIPQPLIQSVKFTNQTLSLTWSAVTGQTYRVEYNDDLNTSNWTALVPDIIATNVTATATNIVPGVPQRFYRILYVP
jgi:hypothetical protein